MYNRRWMAAQLLMRCWYATDVSAKDGLSRPCCVDGVELRDSIRTADNLHEWLSDVLVTHRHLVI